MNVTVKLQGALGRLGDRAPSQPVEFALAEGATAGDLVRKLAARFGEPFGTAPARGNGWLPAGVRMFVGGQMALGQDVPLAAPGTESQKVIVILVSQMQGG